MLLLGPWWKPCACTRCPQCLICCGVSVPDTIGFLTASDVATLLLNWSPVTIAFVATCSHVLKYFLYLNETMRNQKISV